MQIELKELTIRDLVEGYQDKGNDGVVAYGGKLDVRPPFQREFIYKTDQRNAVIDTILHEFPLNVMYWSDRDDGTFEIIDGQQRTISICQYVNDDFPYIGTFFDSAMTFENLHPDEKEEFLNYKLHVYICTGTPREKLK